MNISGCRNRCDAYAYCRQWCSGCKTPQPPTCCKAPPQLPTCCKTPLLPTPPTCSKTPQPPPKPKTEVIYITTTSKDRDVRPRPASADSARSSTKQESQKRPRSASAGSTKITHSKESTKRPRSASASTKSPSKESTKRPRSASASGKNSKGSVTKPASSSDSKVSKNVKTKSKKHSKDDGEVKGKMDAESVQQLKEDLKTIKEQLLFLTKNRNEALAITEQLQERYNDLLKRNEDQERVIEELRQENKYLSEKVRTQQPIGEGPHVVEAAETKKCLDMYESKLNTLYEELLSSTKAMEETKKNICRCSNELSAEKDLEYEKLMKNYKQAKQNEMRLGKEKEELSFLVQELEGRLCGTMRELERLQNEVQVVASRHEESEFFTNQLEKQSREIERLKKCRCDYEKTKKDYHRLLKTHEETLCKMKMYEESHSQRFEEIQRLRKNEKALMAELAQLQNYVNQISEANNRQRTLLAQLEGANQEKESMCQCLQADLASKDKQIEILQKNEDRLKKRAIQLQEEMVGMKIDKTQQRQERVLTTEDCSTVITEELQDLITALYDEIDKTMAKDEQLEQQQRRICYLQCALNCKDKELNGLRNELKILREQFAPVTLHGKRNDHLSRIDEDICGMESCECGAIN